MIAQLIEWQHHLLEKLPTNDLRSFVYVAQVRHVFVYTRQNWYASIDMTSNGALIASSEFVTSWNAMTWADVIVHDVAGKQWSAARFLFTAVCGSVHGLRI